MVKFAKLHGAGNDFVAINGMEDETWDYSELAEKACHRRFGVGADGLLVVKPSEKAECFMLYYNADGSRANMCGNGLRCFVKFVRDSGIVKTDRFQVETFAGVFDVDASTEDGKVKSVKVKMGEAVLAPEMIPVDYEGDRFIQQKIAVSGRTVEVSSVLVGVTHTMVFVDDIDMEEVLTLGPEIEKHPIFPEGTNVNFVKVVDRENLVVYTWERGCGHTLACGTGICASAYVSNLVGLSGESVAVESPGGRLYIEIKDGIIYMDGPAVKICEGILEV